MPQLNRKRRSDAISRDASPSPSASPEPQRSTQRRRRSSESSVSSVSSAASDNPDTQADNQRKTLVKKLVRLALACEYSRLPLRRSDISAKVFKDGAGNGTSSAGSFKKVFEDAQVVLKQTFGMELRELPNKEKSGLNDRRKQATQTTKSSSSANRSWILVSVLPKAYREDLRIVGPNHAPSEQAEAGYIAFCTFLVGLVYLNNGEITEQKMERYLKRVNADTQTAFGSWEKVKTRMVKEGYLERKKDTLSGEDVMSFTVGPRGKMEIGIRGIEGLVRSVYGLGVAGEGGDGPKIEEEELVKRLKRSLGTYSVSKQVDAGAGGGSAGVSAAQSRNATPQPGPAATQQRQRGPRRRVPRDDDDYDGD